MEHEAWSREPGAGSRSAACSYECCWKVDQRAAAINRGSKGKNQGNAFCCSSSHLPAPSSPAFSMDDIMSHQITISASQLFLMSMALNFSVSGFQRLSFF